MLGADQLWPLLEPVLASAAPLRGHSISLRLADLDDDVRLTQPRLAHAADGWATALTAAGEDGPALARRLSIAALFLFHEGQGLRRETTGGFDRYLL